MSTHDASDSTLPSYTGDQSLAELFHLVRSLVPQDQRLFTASPDMTVAEAIQIMRQHNFSQLPVIAGDTVLGVFSFRSLASGLLKIEGGTEQLSDLPVDEFVEHFRFVQPSDNWESTLEYMDSDDGVLVGRRDRLEAIVTSMDVLTYLHEIASPFVILAEIELSLRRIILACVAEEQLQQCIEVSLASKYEKDQAPTRLSDMTFNDYVQIIDHGRNWPHFTAAFGGGKGQRKRTANRLREVRVLRNEIFHFRQQLEPNDLKALTAHRDWLQMKAVAFDARRRRRITVPKKEKKTEAPKTEESTRRKWDESSFFAALEQERSAGESAAARRIFDWAKDKALYIRWGQGREAGTFSATYADLRGPAILRVWTNGWVTIAFLYLKNLPPYDDEKMRLELLHRLNAIRGVNIDRSEIAKDTSLPLSIFADAAKLQQLLDAMNWVVDEIEQCSTAGVGDLVPLEVAKALDPAAGERLQRFLSSLLGIGLIREEGSTADAYKATLLYQFREWDDYRSHAVTVLYLKKESKPSLRFRIDMLSVVQDLNIEELQARLLAAGCTRANRRSTPIELVLTRRNDQATFDRLYEILENLMRKHRVT